ncbi:MASE3 domain-containing protein [uncultured Desulfobacter sp.]|uniref:MASE3 domain-containing protein n=1 Tax=uncultured Desulfobacter sp. TaxID=240139 RepID=UPI0029F4C515|nr:MASE3 domain-containing protein [uncultured Desulfobacter sp.]
MTDGKMKSSNKKGVVGAASFVVMLIGLYICSLYNFLLFHMLAEMFAVVTACSIFVVTWNARKFFKEKQFFPFIGIAYLFVGILDLVHAMTYKGVNIIPSIDANIPTQLWVSARYLESITLLSSFFIFKNKKKAETYLLGFTVVTTLILLSIFYWKIFPDCYLENAGGLTPFKKNSEYAICLILASALGALYFNRARFDKTLFNWLQASILITIVSELLFTTYIGVFSAAIILGHYFKIISFYCLYKALIETGLSQPYSLLYKDLADTRENYQNLFFNMIDGFARHRMILDENGNPVDYEFLETNQAFERLTGLKNVAGKTVTQMLPDIKDDPINWIDVYGNVALKGEPARFENYSASLEKCFSINAYSVNHGEFVTIFEDITERKEAVDALSSQRELLNTTLSHLGDGVISTDKTGRVAFINPAAEKLTGWPRAEALGKKLEQIFNVCRKENNEPTCKADEMDSLYEDQSMVFPDEGTLLHRDGTRIPIEEAVNPVKDKNGDVAGLVLIFRDITMWKQFQKKLQEANELLEDKVAQRTQTLHQTVERLQKEIEQRIKADARNQKADQELRSRAVQLRALAGKLTMAEQAERRRVAKVLHDGIQQYMAAAKLHLSGLERKIEDSRLRGMAIKIEETIGTCIQMARSLSADLSPPALYRGGLISGIRWLAGRMQERYGFRVTFKSEMENVSLPEDIMLLVFESVRELLFNSIKHSGMSEAQVKLTKSENQLCLCVKDAGSGFEPSEISVSENMKQGFGLFSIQERINLIGGTFEIKSEPGQGSRFNILLPYKTEAGSLVADNAPADSLKTDVDKDDSKHSEKEIRVLLADDHAIFRKGVFQSLRETEGIKVVGQAHDGLEIVELAQQLNPDVILMDVNMPGIDGIEATKRIYQAHPNIKILALSMYEKKDYARDMISAGAVDFISKGCSSSEMVAAIRNAATVSL